MGLLSKMFGTPRATRSAQAAASGIGVTATRGQLVRMAHRDTLRRHAIPEDWLELELLTAKDARGAKGVHARLVVTVFDAELMIRLPSLIKAILERLTKLDQSSAHWLHGMSIRFQLPADHAFAPLPAAAPVRHASEGMSSAQPAKAPPAEGTKEWLERMFATAQPATGARRNEFQPTRPMYGSSEP